MTTATLNGPLVTVVEAYAAANELTIGEALTDLVRRGALDAERERQAQRERLSGGASWARTVPARRRKR